MYFVPNANALAEKLLKRDNVVAVYKNMVEQYYKRHRTVFVQQMQVVVTKIGLILSECSSGSKIRTKTYLGSVDYICNNILKNKQLLKIMRVFINDDGNDVKHSIKDIQVEMDTVMEQYNLFIKDIVRVTKLSAFNKYIIAPKKSVRDVPIISEEKHHKFFTIKNFKFQLKICPNYTVDPYTKKVTSKLTLYWPKIAENYYVEISVINVKNKRIVCGKRQIDLGVNIKNQIDGKYALTLNCTEDDLDRRVLNLRVEIILKNKVTKTHYYETGALFWKKTHSYKEDEITVIGSYSCDISQIFKPNSKVTI